MLGHNAESNPEELLDVFKAAALSVTKLYKTSAAVQSKARIEGYQDCLEDLLSVLEKGDVDVRTIRRWAVERLDGREPILPTIESEDEAEKSSTPEPQSANTATGAADRQTQSSSAANNSSTNATTSNSDTAMQTEAEAEADMETEADITTPSPIKNGRTAPASTMAAPASIKKPKTKSRNASIAMTSTTTPSTATVNVDTVTDAPETVEIPPPNFDHFTFRSSMSYPTDSFLEIANLDLSDRRSASGSVKDASEPPPSTTGSSTYVFNAPPQTASTTENTSSPSHTSGSRQFRVRHATGRPNVRSALTARYNRASAGQKRKLNFAEIFDLASLGYGKDESGRGGGKRSRQA
ncbi:hypothetical protein SEUCBS140593_006484 [Sporothrix eucalyptigena]|uniref:Uncharacterized protein n=1 Tax=Sporothrix eucalyptigena TaxID=1812306 RepID=A0ABP0C6I2_9PEZI